MSTTQRNSVFMFYFPLEVASNRDVTITQYKTDWWRRDIQLLSVNGVDDIEGASLFLEFQFRY